MEYEVKKEPDIEQPDTESFLDPNHTHFILVDDGAQLSHSSATEFFVSLEKNVARIKTETDKGTLLVFVKVYNM